MIGTLLLVVLAAQEAAPASNLVPPTPADWVSERIEFPLGFAPDIELEGVEELRFAPGMFKSGADSHWTYLFGLDVAPKGGGELDVDQAFLEDFLLRYYRGLCGAVAESRSLELDAQRIRAQVAGGGAAFSATVELFDVFGDGAPVVLAIDFLVHPRAEGTELLGLAAPATASEAVRAELDALGQAWRSARPVPVFLNHVILIPDLATYEALVASPRLRELAVVEERETRRGDTAYTGLYLYGPHTYLQVLKPDPAAGLLPGGSGVAFCVELPGGLERVASALQAAGVETSAGDVTRELEGVQLPWFRLLGFQTAAEEQRVQLFAMEYSPEFLQRWHAPAQEEPARIDRKAIIGRTAAVLGAHRDAPFGDVRCVELVLNAAEHERYGQIARGLELDTRPVAGDPSSASTAEHGVHFRMSADAKRQAPGGVACIEFELRFPLEKQELDFGQIKLSIQDGSARFLFDGLPIDHGSLARRFDLPEFPRGIAFSPDGKKVAVACFDQAIHVFDVTSGEQTLRVETPNLIDPIAIASDGSVIAAGASGFPKDKDYPLHIFDLASGKELARAVGHTQSVEALAYSPDGTTLASASNDGTIRLWDTATWQPRLAISCGEEGSKLEFVILRGVAFTPDGKQVAGFGGAKSGDAQWDKPIARIWEVESGRLTAELNGHAGLVLRGDFSSDGKTLVTASRDRTLRAWDVTTGNELRRVEIHRKLYGFGFSPDRKQIVLCDGMLKIFDLATFENVSSLGSPAMDIDFSRFVFSPDGKLLATNCNGNDIHLWDVPAR